VATSTLTARTVTDVALPGTLQNEMAKSSLALHGWTANFLVL